MSTSNKIWLGITMLVCGSISFGAVAALGGEVGPALCMALLVNLLIWEAANENSSI